MQKVRTRLVNFRVTDEEFEQLKSASDRHGARCLSDFARSVMFTAQNADSEGVTDQVIALGLRVASLEHSMSRLISDLAALKVDLAVSEN